MATFSGNAAGYRFDFLDNGKIRVVDIDDSDGDTGARIVGSKNLIFDDRTYRLGDLSETRVNTTIFSNQSDAQIATSTDGGYVITWQSDSPSGWNIYAQRFDAAGNALGDETRVNAVTSGTKYGSEIAVTGLDDGSYVIAWEGDGNSGANPPGVYAQRYDAAGNTVGGETLVGASGYDPAVTALADGGYLIAWQYYDEELTDGDTYVKHYDAAGNEIESTTRPHTANSAVAALADGSYVVTWGSDDGVFAQRYDAAGNALGGETLLIDEGALTSREITALADGGYVLAWNTWEGFSTRRFDAAGNAMGDIVSVGTYGRDEFGVTGLADGGYVLTWGYYDIFAQRYDAAGNAVGLAVRVNAVTSETQAAPAVTGLADGGYVITWHSYAQDGHGDGVFARRFDANGESIASGLSLTGTNGHDVMNGGMGMQYLLGLNGNDTLSGGIGNDILDGAYDDDILVGGYGDDVLLGGDGNDVLTGGKGNDSLSGDGGYDTLSGGAGDDILRGGKRGDSLAGGSGNDRMSGGIGKDVLHGNGGNDKMDGGKDADILYGGAGDDVMSTGWYGGDTFYGGAGDDIILGGRYYQDILDGGTGSDTLTGMIGADIFRFHTEIANGRNVDKITDFSVSEGDVIELGASVFDALTAGALDASHFAANAEGAAQDANDYIVYETDTGKLFYDADGNGAGAQILFAVIGNGAALTAADFSVV